MKVRLIAPAQRQVEGKKGLFPPLSLAMLAALTPDTWEVEVIDENVQVHDADTSADLVGLTAITAVAPRAYQLAGQYREMGVPVVMGGMHASALPTEALQYVDAVVVGEAEPVWEDVLRDAERGKLRQLYQAADRPCLAGLPSPRRDIFDKNRYVTTNLVQTSRGCPNNCEFCAVTQFFGRTYRTRPVDEIVQEIADMSNPGLVLFVDDNIVGDRSYARRLFQELRSLKVRWFGQSSLAIAQDEDILDLAADSGCVGLFIGFESLISKNLQQMKKGLVNQVGKFHQAAERIYQRGIGIEGAFIFGMDEDDPSVFQRTLEFAQQARLALAQFGILTPFPGTPLYETMAAEGRIVETDWSKYTISNVVTQPRQLSRRALEEGFMWTYREFYSYHSILKRLLPRLGNNFWLFLGLNMAFKRVSDRMIAAKRALLEEYSRGVDERGVD